MVIFNSYVKLPEGTFSSREVWLQNAHRAVLGTMEVCDGSMARR